MCESDEELNDLLDDAIKDFKVEPTKRDITNLPEDKSSLLNPLASSTKNDSAFNDKMFEDVFKELAGNLPNSFNKDFASFLNNPEFNEHMQPDITEKLKSTFDSLKEDMQFLPQNENLVDEDLLKLIKDLGTGDEALQGFEGMFSGDLKEDSLFSAMQGMMRNLLSKDIIYPLFKDISSQYPEWLANNETTASKPDLDRYRSQYSIIKGIVDEFDREMPGDSEGVKMERFQRFLDSVQALQLLGKPPEELLGNFPKDVEVDSNGYPKLAAGLFSNPANINTLTNNCSLM